MIDRIEEFTETMRENLRKRLGREPSSLECELEFAMITRPNDLKAQFELLNLMINPEKTTLQRGKPKEFDVNEFMTPTKTEREVAYIAHGLRLSDCIGALEALNDDLGFGYSCQEVIAALKVAYKTYLEQRDLFIGGSK